MEQGMGMARQHQAKDSEQGSESVSPASHPGGVGHVTYAPYILKKYPNWPQKAIMKIKREYYESRG